jgi:hypothetical protein
MFTAGVRRPHPARCNFPEDHHYKIRQ